MLNEEELRQTRFELIQSLSEISGYHPDNYSTQLMVTTAIKACDKLYECILDLTKQPSLVKVYEGCRCQDCGNYFRSDFVVSDEVWEKIKPHGKPEGAGLLCGSCIGKRLEEIGNGKTFIIQEDE